MQTSAYKTFGVTLAFAIGALLVTLALYVLSVLIFSGDSLLGVDDWRRLALVLVANAAIAGLAVDLLRYAAERFWPRDPAISGARTSPRDRRGPQAS